MKLEFFKPEHFSAFYLPGEDPRELAANTANELLNAALGPKVYGGGNGVWEQAEDPTKTNTHEAFIFNIQPIKKKCGHTEIFGSVTKYLEIQHKCLQCGAILKPTGWVEV